MDHRCLYGHRVSSELAYAVSNRQCPVCGAPTVSVVGYQMARRLAAETQMDAMVAFQALQLIEADFVLTPHAPATDAGTAAPPEPDITEFELAEEPPEAQAAAPEPASEGPGLDEETAGSSEPRVNAPTPEPANEQRSADPPTDGGRPRTTDFGDVERGFFDAP